MTTQTQTQTSTDAPKADEKKVKKVKKAKPVADAPKTETETPKADAPKPVAETPKPVEKKLKPKSDIQRLREFIVGHPELKVDEIGPAAREAGVIAEDGTVRTVAYHTRQTIAMLSQMDEDERNSILNK